VPHVEPYVGSVLPAQEAAPLKGAPVPASPPTLPRSPRAPECPPEGEGHRTYAEE